jgi:hypothetical protein
LSKARKPPAKPPAKPYRLNELQKKALEAYEDGDFANLGGMEWKSFEEFSAYMTDHVDDGLLRFVLVEIQDLAEDEVEDAMNRMSRALDQLNDVFGGLAALHREQMARVPGA